MNDSFNSLESVMKEINALKFSDQSEQSAGSISENSIPNKSYSNIEYSESDQQSHPKDNANLQGKKPQKLSQIDFCKQISIISGKPIITLQDALKQYKRDSKKGKANTIDDTTQFINSFNMKYHTSISSLQDIFTVFDDIKYKASGISSNQLGKQQGSLGQANAQISALMEQNTALIQAKNSFEKAFASAEELLEAQIEETRKLSQQRNKLVQYLQTMDVICREIDDTGHNLKLDLAKRQCQPSPQAKVIIQQVEKPKSEDESYQLLAATYRTIESTLHPTFKDELEAIRDNSSKTPKDRIISLVKCLSSNYFDDQQKQNKLQKENDEQKNQIESMKKQCNDILVHFEDELRFIQKLSHSKDLQSVLLYRPATGCTLGFDSAEKEELIKRCAEIGKFIDENVGKLLAENFETHLTDFESLNSDSIFSLMQPINLEKKISSIIKDTKDYSPESRKIIDLLVAQVLMNDILTSHALDLHSRVLSQNRQIQKLNQDENEISDVQQQITTFQKEIKALRRHDYKIKRRLSKVVQFNDDADVLDVIQQLIEALKKARKIQKASSSGEKNAKKLSEGTSPFQSFSDGNTNKKNKKNREENDIENNNDEQYSQKIKLLEAKINELNNTLKESTQAHEQEISKQKEINQTYYLEVEKQRESVQKINEENVSKIKSYEDMLEQCKNDASTLQQKLDDSVTTLKKISAQYKKTESANAAAIIENQQLKKRVKQLENINIKGVEAIKTKSIALRSQYEATIAELEKIKNDYGMTQQVNLKYQAEIEKFKAEIDELRIQNKALMLKIKANEEKHILEMKTVQSQIAANTTSVQADVDHAIKESEEKMQDFKQQILEITMKFNECTEPIEAIKSLSELITELRKVQSVYASMIEDIQNLQKLLNIEPGMRITPNVEKIVNQFAEAKNQIQELQKGYDILNTDKQKITRDLLKNQSQIASLIQWDTWAKRVLRVVKDSDCAQFSSNLLRQTLEEMIFMSLSNRSTIGKIDILRQEKQLITRYDPRLLSIKSNQKTSFNSILIAILTARRLLKLAGITPIVMDQTPLSPKIKRKHKGNT